MCCRVEDHKILSEGKKKKQDFLVAEEGVERNNAEPNITTKCCRKAKATNQKLFSTVLIRAQESLREKAAATATAERAETVGDTEGKKKEGFSVCVHACVCDVCVRAHGRRWMSNLWQKLQDGSGEQRANCKRDEKGERILHIACLDERNDEDSSEGEGIDHGHTQERKTPHWGGGRDGEGGDAMQRVDRSGGDAVIMGQQAAKLQTHITSRCLCTAPCDITRGIYKRIKEKSWFV